MMFSHGEPRCAIAVWNLHAHGNAGCTVVWQPQVVVGWKEMSLGSTVKLRDWVLDAMEYGSSRANAWLLVSWLGGDKRAGEVGE